MFGSRPKQFHRGMTIPLRRQAIFPVIPVGAPVPVVPRGHDDLTTAIKSIGQDPEKWSGTYHLHLGGKTGEVIFATGILPSIRKILPKAKLVLHVVAHYLPVIERCTIKPDDVVTYAPMPGRAVFDQVVNSVIQMRNAHPSIAMHGSDLATSLYRKHPWPSHALLPTSPEFTPFYRMFAHGAGVNGYDKPGWETKSEGESPIALAFPTSNPHSGSTSSIPLTPQSWERLADVLKCRGIRPIANTFKEDPKLLPAGWSPMDGSVSEVLELLTKAKFVIGLNSGITFAGVLLSPGRVVMVDYQKKPFYDFGNMISDGVVRPADHVQIDGHGGPGFGTHLAAQVESLIASTVL